MTTITDAERAAKITTLKAEIIERQKAQRAEAWEAGYCIHGKYVGGMGVDWICQDCEDGLTIDEMVDSYMAVLVEEVTDTLEIANILTRMEKRVGFETPIISDMRNALVRLYSIIWEDADKRAVFQILHEKIGA